MRASSSAHILHPNPPDNPPCFLMPEDKLTCFSSLAHIPSESTPLDIFRVSLLPLGGIHLTAGPSLPPLPESLFTLTAKHTGSLFTPTVKQQGLIFPGITLTSPTSAHSILSHPSTLSLTLYCPPPSPVMSQQSAPCAQSPTPPPPPSPLPKSKPLPYNPHWRMPAGSVLEPLTLDEMHFYHTQLGTGMWHLAKCKHSPLYELPDHQPITKKTCNAGCVMEHCTLLFFLL